MAAKKTVPTVNKAEYVRSLPIATPVGDVVERAKAEGIALTKEYVHNVRAHMKIKARERTAKARAARHDSAAILPSFLTPKADKQTDSKVEDLLIAVAAEMGIGNAIARLEQERARVRGMLRG